MVVDSSAILAIYLQEDDAQFFADTISAGRELKMAAPTFLEATIAAVSKRGPIAAEHIRENIETSKIEIVPFGLIESDIAIRAFLKYGKGRGHPAQLNFGDCISYAMSKTELMPLLFKGNDFRLTDVDCAI